MATIVGAVCLVLARNVDFCGARVFFAGELRLVLLSQNVTGNYGDSALNLTLF
jgi:hypothetical protein